MLLHQLPIIMDSSLALIKVKTEEVYLYLKFQLGGIRSEFLKLFLPIFHSKKKKITKQLSTYIHIEKKKILGTIFAPPHFTGLVAIYSHTINFNHLIKTGSIRCCGACL